MVDYPAFRRPRYAPIRGARRRRRDASFVSQLLMGCAAVAVVTWNAAPQLSLLWAAATRSPEEIAGRQISAYYRNCDAARAAGADPIYRGEPGYRSELDGDADGIACEPYRRR